MYIMSYHKHHAINYIVYHVLSQAPLNNIHLLYHVTTGGQCNTLQHLSYLITSNARYGATVNSTVYIMQHHNAEYNVAYHVLSQLPWYMNYVTFYVKFYHKCSTKICNATLYMMTYHKARRYLIQNLISCSITNNTTMIHDTALEHMPRGMSAMIHISWHRLNRCLGYCVTKSCRNLIILVCYNWWIWIYFIFFR